MRYSKYFRTVINIKIIVGFQLNYSTRPLGGRIDFPVLLGNENTRFIAAQSASMSWGQPCGVTSAGSIYIYISAAKRVVLSFPSRLADYKCTCYTFSAEGGR
mmetsp:Transcript_8901/g.11197  ORF Transcript_8901/g.11197 Transcript_8901/m.11197 type:complete len:102 (-) Transcript_8901:574-879(-)